MLLIALFLVAGSLIVPQPSQAVPEGIPCIPEPTDMAVSYGDLVTCQITPIGDIDLFRFAGSAGEVVDILVSRQTGGWACLQLFDPTGGEVAVSCFGGNAEIRSTLTKAGTHTIRVTERFADETLGYSIVMQCLVAPCASSLFPTIATTLTGCTTCSPGNTFGANASITNPTARWLEIKAGVYLPDRTPVNLLGDKHIELPPGFTFNGPVFSTTIPNGLPQGTYQFCGLLLERELGRSLAESCHTFTIGP